MYGVYQIINKINGKMYFGSSADVYRRWREHQSKAFNVKSVCYNYPLQKALRKYGTDNFIFTVLRNDFETRYEAEEYEQNLILRYDTVSNNGYNQTAITHNGLTDDIIRNKLKTAVVAIKLDNPEEKIYFPSVAVAADKLQSDRASIHACIRGEKRHSKVKGYVIRKIEDNQIIEPELTTQMVIDEYNRTNPLINGERHNLKEWLEKLGITRTAYYARLRSGMTQIEALTTKKKRG